MEKTDILKESLVIKRIIAVTKGRSTQIKKFVTRKSRHSDALAYILSGSCTLRFDDGVEFTVHKGDVMYLPNASGYTMFVHEKDYTFIFSDFEFFSDEKRLAAVFTFENNQNIEALFTKLLNCYRSSEYSMSECMSGLYNIYSAILKNSKQSYLGRSKENEIEKAKRFIDENFANPALSVEELAKSVGISETYFRRLFKAKYKTTPSQHLLSVRLENARMLMKYSFVSINDCALQSGFSSSQYFCRIFKREFGISPGKYKRDG